VGKLTKAQQRSKDKAPKVDAATPVKDLGEGVYITRQNDDAVQAFKGDYQAQLTPDGSIAVLEMVPDVGNKNKGQPTAHIRQFINGAVWAEVIIK